MLGGRWNAVLEDKSGGREPERARRAPKGPYVKRTYSFRQPLRRNELGAFTPFFDEVNSRQSSPHCLVRVAQYDRLPFATSLESSFRKGGKDLPDGLKILVTQETVRLFFVIKPGRPDDGWAGEVDLARLVEHAQRRELESGKVL